MSYSCSVFGWLSFRGKPLDSNLVGSVSNRRIIGLPTSDACSICTCQHPVRIIGLRYVTYHGSAILEVGRSRLYPLRLYTQASWRRYLPTNCSGASSLSFIKVPNRCICSFCCMLQANNEPDIPIITYVLYIVSWVDSLSSWRVLVIAHAMFFAFALCHQQSVSPRHNQSRRTIRGKIIGVSAHLPFRLSIIKGVSIGYNYRNNTVEIFPQLFPYQQVSRIRLDEMLLEILTSPITSSAVALPSSTIHFTFHPSQFL